MTVAMVRGASTCKKQEIVANEWGEEEMVVCTRSDGCVHYKWWLCALEVMDVCTQSDGCVH